jgi:hypothetical protein
VARRSSLTGSCVAVVALLAACSSTEGSGHSQTPVQDSGSANGNETQHATKPSKGLDDLTVPEDGFQVRNAGAEIDPGQDVEYCEIGELPGDPSETYYVHSVELANAPYSHHFVVATALPDSAAEAALQESNIGDKVVCNGANYQWPEEGLVFLGSAQTPYISRGYPKGVGTTLHGHQRVVFDYHYLNTTDHPIQARSAFNVHLVDSSEIEHIATAFSFFNFTVDVPPHDKGSFVAECHFSDDLIVPSVLRHTHEHGRDFSIWYSGGQKDGELIWTSRDWKEETDFLFPSPTLVKAGEGFRFQCDFENEGDAPLRYGIKGTDEMCILAGWFWPAGETRELGPQSCGVTWLDGKGIGHPASEAGGFPPAPSLDARLCHGGISLSGYAGLSDETCNDCICKSCGTILLQCAKDADCTALLDCFGSGCGSQTACIQACKTEIHDHSSAVGMLQQVEACVSSKCGGCGPVDG